ncbi:hypothetical protein D6D27_05783 [Aureobasidium pullulans]|nr:hypothetical protein D6D27_05783 [Aureobasidium pullulans]
MKPSLITAFLAFATSTLAIAIPSPTSAISTASPSSILRSAHSKQTDDNDKPGKSAHECDEILEECKKGARTERFCQEYTCYKTKGACYSGHCDTYRRARRALAGGLRHNEQGINDLTIAAPTPTTFATETSSASKAGDSDVDEGYAPRPEDLDDDCMRTNDFLKQEMCQGKTIAVAEGAEMFVQVQGAQVLFYPDALDAATILEKETDD